MSLIISRILHAGYLFETAQTKILFDPIFENPFSHNCYAFPSVRFFPKEISSLQLGAVFISHYHDDHCSFASLNLIRRETPIYIYCQHAEIFDWVKQLGFTSVHSLELNRSIKIGDVEITARRALDSDVDSILHIRAGEINVLNMVDSWIDPNELSELIKTPWDMLLWPFQTMLEIAIIAPSLSEPAELTLPPEWVEQLQLLNPRYVVPSSCQFIHEPWSWYNHALFPITYRQFEKEIRLALPEAQVIRLDPSVGVNLNRSGITPSPLLSWVIPIGPQDVDYEFDPSLIPPGTAEIARRFPVLESDQSASLENYCKSGLIKKYRAMDAPSNTYFATPRRWRLSIFDEHGVATDFEYLIHKNKIELCHGRGEPDWRTEIPAHKLYSALFHGEALTSLYLRVDAREKGVDVMEDPLIRCLYTGVFGSYQREQMKKLMKDRDESRDPDRAR